MMGKEFNSNMREERFNNNNKYIEKSSPFTVRKLNKRKDELTKKWSIAIILSMIEFDENHCLINRENFRCKIKGIRNLGNTCYMNSVLQCLLNLEGFNAQLLRQLIIKAIKRNNNNKCHQYKEEYDEEHLSQEYMNLLGEFISTTNNNIKNNFEEKECPRLYRYSYPAPLHEVINPEKLKSLISKKIIKFDGYRQHDAQEFLTEFLLTINNELSRVDRSKKPEYKTLNNDPGCEYERIESLSQEWCEYFKEREDSIVNDMFEGQSVSIIECKECKTKTVTFNNFRWLPVSFISSNANKYFDYQQSSNNNTIEQMLCQEWNTTNELEDYYCNNCQDLQHCQEHVSLFKLPNYLVVQLKRFEEGPYGRKKVNDKVRVGEEVLDLSSMVHERSKESDKKCAYRLNSTVHHVGTVHAGHYTSRVYKEQEQQWYKLNDSMTSEEQKNSEEESSSVYLLFYERVE